MVGNGVNVAVLRGVADGITSSAIGAVGVAVGCTVGLAVEVDDGVTVCVGGLVGVCVAVLVFVRVEVAVLVAAGLAVGVAVWVFGVDVGTVGVIVALGVAVAVRVNVGDGVEVLVPTRAISVSACVGEITIVGVCGASTFSVQPVNANAISPRQIRKTLIRIIMLLYGDSEERRERNGWSLIFRRVPFLSLNVCGVEVILEAIMRCHACRQYQHQVDRPGLA